MADNIVDLREPLLPPDQDEHQTNPIPIIYSSSIPYDGANTFSTSSILGTSEESLYDHSGRTDVAFLNLNENTVFDKFQSRRGGEAKMRVCNGNIEMVCNSPAQILCIKVFVFRELSAAELCCDRNGRMELPVKMGKMVGPDRSGTCQQYFFVDLNSIYDGPIKPAYELAKVETEKRNLFQLAVQVQCIGRSGFQEFTSVPFLLRTRPKKSNKASKRIRISDPMDSSDENSPDTSRPRLGSGVPQSNFVQCSPGTESSEFRADHIDCQNLNVINHLKASNATINHLMFDEMESPTNADLGYRFKLMTPHLETYDEGDIVGFFKDKDDGTYIELLDSINAQDAFMAGVISQSAYLVANQSLDKDSSDVVCVIGVVKVKCAGSARAGERIYASLIEKKAGTAIAESHLPPGAILNNRGTLLGMALEEKKTKKPDEEMLVKCFVCIVLGITDKKLTMEIENMYDNVEMSLNDKLDVERKRARRRLCLSMGVLVFLLLGLSVLAFQLFYPGSALREAICRAGSVKGRYATFTFIEKTRAHSYDVTVIEFPSYEELQKKVSPALDHMPRLDPTLFNLTKVNYYLNLYRCSYGGIKLQDTIKFDPKKQIGGAIVVAIDVTCTKVFYCSDTHPTPLCKGDWCPYQSVHKTLHCFPKT